MPCKMCGMCCRVSLLCVQQETWTPDLEQLLILKGKQYIATQLGTRYYVFSAPCPHLDLITNRCRIQGHKPKFCREYPAGEPFILPGCGYRK